MLRGQCPCGGKQNTSEELPHTVVMEALMGGGAVLGVLGQRYRVIAPLPKLCGDR